MGIHENGKRQDGVRKNNTLNGGEVTTVSEMNDVGTGTDSPSDSDFYSVKPHRKNGFLFSTDTQSSSGFAAELEALRKQSLTNAPHRSVSHSQKISLSSHVRMSMRNKLSVTTGEDFILRKMS